MSSEEPFLHQDGDRHRSSYGWPQRRPDDYVDATIEKKETLPDTPQPTHRLTIANRLQLLLRTATLLCALALLACTIIITNVRGPAAYILRAAPAATTLHCAYALWFQLRRRRRSPSSCATYAACAAIIDLLVDGFHGFSAWACYEERITHAKDEWGTRLGHDAKKGLVPVMFILYVVTGALHLLSLALDAFLFALYRRLRHAHPDADEDTEKTPRPRRRRNKLADWRDRESKYLSGATLVGQPLSPGHSKAGDVSNLNSPTWLPEGVNVYQLPFSEAAQGGAGAGPRPGWGAAKDDPYAIAYQDLPVRKQRRGARRRDGKGRGSGEGLNGCRSCSGSDATSSAEPPTPPALTAIAVDGDVVSMEHVSLDDEGQVVRPIGDAAGGRENSNWFNPTPAQGQGLDNSGTVVRHPVPGQACQTSGTVVRHGIPPALPPCRGESADWFNPMKTLGLRQENSGTVLRHAVPGVEHSGTVPDVRQQPLAVQNGGRKNSDWFNPDDGEGLENSGTVVRHALPGPGTRAKGKYVPLNAVGMEDTHYFVPEEDEEEDEEEGDLVEKEQQRGRGTGRAAFENEYGFENAYGYEDAFAEDAEARDREEKKQKQKQVDSAPAPAPVGPPQLQLQTQLNGQNQNQALQVRPPAGDLLAPPAPPFLSEHGAFEDVDIGLNIATTSNIDPNYNPLTGSVHPAGDVLLPGGPETITGTAALTTTGTAAATATTDINGHLISPPVLFPNEPRRLTPTSKDRFYAKPETKDALAMSSPTETGPTSPTRQGMGIMRRPTLKRWKSKTASSDTESQAQTQAQTQAQSGDDEPKSPIKRRPTFKRRKSKKQEALERDVESVFESAAAVNARESTSGSASASVGTGRPRSMPGSTPGSAWGSDGLQMVAATYQPATARGSAGERGGPATASGTSKRNSGIVAEDWRRSRGSASQQGRHARSQSMPRSRSPVKYRAPGWAVFHGL